MERSADFGAASRIPVEVVRAVTQTFLEALPEPSLRHLLRDAEVLRLGRKAELFHAGAPFERLYILLEGTVELSGRVSGGKEIALQILQPTAPIVLSAALSAAAYPLSARAAKPTRVLSVPTRALRSGVRDDLRIARAVLDALSVHTTALLQDLSDLKLKTTTERLACYLLDLAEQSGGRQECTLPHEKHLLASHLGMTPESLSRAFAALREFGISVRGSRIVFEDTARLAAFCCRAPGTPADRDSSYR